MNVKKELVKQYSDNTKEMFKRFLLENGFRSILLADNSFSTILYDGRLTTEGEYLLTLLEETEVSLNELEEYMSRNRASVQTIMSLKNKEIPYASFEDIKRDFALQKFRVVSDNSIRELMGSSVYKKEKVLENRLSKEFKKLNSHPIWKLSEHIPPEAGIILTFIYLGVSGFLGYVLLSPTWDSLLLGLTLGIGTIGIFLIYYTLKTNSLTTQMQKIRKRFKQETYGNVVDTFTERESVFKI